MKKYEGLVICEINDLAESVYAASGAGTGGDGGNDNCYSFTSRIVQKPELGNEVYTIQIDGTHNATHHSTDRSVLVAFNMPVTYVSSNAASYSGDGTTCLRLVFTDGINGAYHNNGSDYIGLGELKVKADAGLAVVSTSSDYCNKSCTGYGH